MAFVQGKAAHGATNASNQLSVTLTSAVGNGNFVAVYALGVPNGLTATVADNQSNNYTAKDSLDSAPDSIHWGSFILGNITNAPQTITVTFSAGSGNPAVVVAVEYSGALAVADPTDGHAIVLRNAPGTGANAITSSSIITTVNGDTILGVAFDTGGVTVPTAGTSPLTFTGRTSDTGGQNSLLTEDAVQSSAGSVNVAFTSSAGANNFAVIVIAVKPAAGGAATPTWGFSSRREDERPAPVRLAEYVAPFFRPSQIPVPTTWLPITGADKERLPPVQRTDWAPTWFLQSQIPVPQRWLPTAGEQDHPPVIKRPPDEPTGWFLKAAAVNSTPSRWLPTTGEVEHPVPPPRTDWASPWFVRSPNPVPSTWLPTTGQEDRPTVKVDQYQAPYFRSPASVPPIWLPTTGQEDRPPPFKPDLSVPSFIRPPAAAAVAISGMAWWRQTEVYFNVPSPQLDYHPAWDPRFIVQIGPTFVEIYNNEFLSPVAAVGHIKRNP